MSARDGRPNSAALELECPQCHSLAGVACATTVDGRALELREVWPPHARRLAASSAAARARILAAEQVKGTPAQLVPMNQQLDAAGELHDIAPAHERSRLFTPAPEQMPGQLGLGLEDA